ncbi:hypothetical protein J6590_023892 [Homalodisca vitripennis]|nr:hypothetical protein J6590_023892 [Homalodisca vitripennis]
MKRRAFAKHNNEPSKTRGIYVSSRVRLCQRLLERRRCESRERGRKECRTRTGLVSTLRLFVLHSAPLVIRQCAGPVSVGLSRLDCTRFEFSPGLIHSRSQEPLALSSSSRFRDLFQVHTQQVDNLRAHRHQPVSAASVRSFRLRDPVHVSVPG